MPEEFEYDLPKREKPDKEMAPEKKPEKPATEEPIEAEKGQYVRAIKDMDLEEAEEIQLVIPKVKVITHTHGQIYCCLYLRSR